MEAEESGSDLAILIYRASPIRPDQLLLPFHQNLHANLEISREAQVVHKQAQGDHYDRKAKKVQVLQQFQSVRFLLYPQKPIRQKATDIFVQRFRTSHTNRPFASWHSRGTKPPCWRASDALGEEKQRKLPFKWCVLVVCLIPLRVLFSSTADLYHVNFKLQRAYILLCDYRNRGHLDKVDESGYRKIKILSKKVGCGAISSVQKQ